MATEDIKIPAPWGFIAAKTWGDESNYAIICVHGTLDNAGSFDTLIPLLPQSFYYVCIDLPGHGMSSHFNKALPISYHNLLLSLKIVCDFLARETYILLGHSLGARFCVVHTQLYPSSVSKLVLIDSTYTLPQPPFMYLNSLLDTHENLMKSLTFKDEDKPLISYETAVRKVMNSRFNGVLTPETAEQIARRMVTKVGDDQYRFTYDYRLRSIITPPLDPEYIEELLKIRPIHCPTVVFGMEETLNDCKNIDWMKNYLTLMKDAENHVVKNGHHHSHHTNPELIADTISKFLLKDQSKL